MMRFFSMKIPHASLLAAALLLAGCATQTKDQIAEARAAGISASLVQKLERGRALSPDDLIELRRRRVSDTITLRQIDRAGIDYLVDKDITRKLRKAGVSEAVITAATGAGERYDAQARHPYVSPWYGPYGYPYYGYPYDPFYYGYVRPYPYRFQGPIFPGSGPRFRRP